jgi:putative endonuclease
MARRLAAHNAGKGAKATRPGRPWTVAYQEGPMLKGVALRRELEIKRLTREAKDRLIRG